MKKCLCISFISLSICHVYAMNPRVRQQSINEVIRERQIIYAIQQALESNKNINGSPDIRRAGSEERETPLLVQIAGLSHYDPKTGSPISNPILVQLLKIGAHPMYASPYCKENAFHRSAAHGASKNLEDLIVFVKEKYPKLLPWMLNQTNRYGQTPLHAAAQSDHYECAQVLLKEGANPDTQDCDGDTPLHLAVCNTNKRTPNRVKRTIVALLGARANSDLINSHNETPQVSHDFLKPWERYKGYYKVGNFLETLIPIKTTQRQLEIARQNPNFRNECYLGKLPRELFNLLENYMIGTHTQERNGKKDKRPIDKTLLQPYDRRISVENIPQA